MTFPHPAAATTLHNSVVYRLNGIHLERASDIPPISVDWVWPHWLPRGKITIVAGQPGAGKTTLLLSTIAVITNGHLEPSRFPDGSCTPVGNVIIWTGEDGIEDTLVPRLIAAGANLSRVHIVRGAFDNGQRRAFDFATDIPKLRDAVVEMGNVVLILIDSIVQAVSGDSNKNSAVRRSLEPLVDLAQEFSSAIVGITHVNKASKGKEPLDRVNGSLAYVAVARMVWLVAKVPAASPDEPYTNCALVRAKSSVGPEDGGYAYQIRPAIIQGDKGPINTSKIVWGSEPLQGSAREILKFAESGGVFENTGAVDKAVEFLSEILAHGELPFPEIQSRATAADISMTAIKRARSILNVQSRKAMGVGPASPSLLSLPQVQSRPGLSTNFQNGMALGEFHAPNFGPPVPPTAPNNQPLTIADHARWQSEGNVPLSTIARNTDPADPPGPVEYLSNEFGGAVNQLQLQRCIDGVCQLYRAGVHDEDANDPAAFQERVIEEAMDVVFGDNLDYSEAAKLRNTLGGINWVAQLQQVRPH